MEVDHLNNKNNNINAKQLLYIVDKLQKNSCEYYREYRNKYLRMYIVLRKFKKTKKFIIKCQKNIRRFLIQNQIKKKIFCANKILNSIRRYFFIRNIKAIKIQRKFRNRGKNLNSYISTLLKSKKELKLKLEELDIKFVNSKTNIKQFLCPISHEIPIEPIFCTTDGNIYNKKHIELWIDRHQTSPINRKVTYKNNLISLIKLSNIWNDKIINKQENSNGICWYEKGVINWIFNPDKKKIDSPVLSFIDSDPTQRHEFKMRIEKNKNLLNIHIDNEFKNIDYKVKFPLKNSIKIQINDNIKYLYPCDFISGCIVDIYKDNSVIYENIPISYLKGKIFLDTLNDFNLNAFPIDPIRIDPITCQPINNSKGIDKIIYYKGNKSKFDFDFCFKYNDVLTETGQIFVKVSKDDINKLSLYEYSESDSDDYVDSDSDYEYNSYLNSVTPDYESSSDSGIE